VRVRVFVEPQNGGTYDQQLAVAKTAESVGFDAFFRSDHYLTMSGDGMPGPTDSWVTLAGLARETTSIRLGTLLSSATFRLPGPFAVAIAEVDAMSRGRVELGLGAGWFEQEHKAYGVPFYSVKERFDRLEEQLAIITGLWKSEPGSKFSFDGNHYQVTDSPGLPKPVQSPHPPVIVGGAGPRRTPDLAVKFATEYNVPFFPPGDLAKQFALVKEGCERAGRDPSSIRFSAATTICCGANAKELERRAAKTGQPLENLRQYATAGTPPEVVDRLGEFCQAGAEAVYLQLLDMDDLDQIRLLGEDVLPNV
jgi:F420-dependent oxidoreductase-like protein